MLAISLIGVVNSQAVVAGRGLAYNLISGFTHQHDLL